jgi:hypothetical protein
MNRIYALSDHYDNWSDRSALRNAPETARGASAQAAVAEGSSPGIVDRTLQTLRQTRMQVCRRTRPWSQVLPVGQPIRRQPPDGLRPAGLPRPGGCLPEQQPFDPVHSGRDLRDQPRVVAAEREALGGSCGLRSATNRDRHQAGGDSDSQHVAVPTRCCFRRQCDSGGDG